MVSSRRFEIPGPFHAADESSAHCSSINGLLWCSLQEPVEPLNLRSDESQDGVVVFNPQDLVID